MISRFYVHNFRCLENFELPISGQSSALLIGKNGTGKTTVSFALEILQRVARGTNRVGDLVKPKDFSRGRTDVPMRFELEAKLDGHKFGYAIAFEFPQGFRELRVREEKLTIDSQPVYTREIAQVHLARHGQDREVQFSIDWHLVAMPVIQAPAPEYPGLPAIAPTRADPLDVFKQWLARMLILRPMPSSIRGDSDHETLRPNPQVTDFGAWFSGLLAHAPSAYSTIEEYLRQVMPDLKDIKNPQVGRDFRSLLVQFSNEQGSMMLPFDDLSDGEKCFMVGALVLAANKTYGPLFCFWDEPDNYLAPSEVGHFVLALRSSFQPSGQFIATSHHPEAIRRFSEENTFVLDRKSHLEPTIVRPLSELQMSGDLVDALVRGDVEL